MFTNNKTTKRIVTFFVFLSFGVGCKKWADVAPPVTSTTNESVFNADNTAIAVLTGLYARMSSTPFNDNGSGLPSLTKKAGLSADEFRLWSGATTFDIPFYRNSLSPGALGGSGGANSATGYEYWNTCYSLIFNCNAALEGLSGASQLTPSVKQQLTGEAKFIRAFLYFYLVNLYGDIPLALTTDYNVNRLLARSSKNLVYDQIIQDLLEARELLSSNFLDASLLKETSERIRPTRWAAEALLARAYLYNEEYSNAESASTELINNSSVFELQTLENCFVANSMEAIWQLQPVYTNGTGYWNTEDARLFVLTAAPQGLSALKPVYLSPFLLSAFEDGDNRLTKWVGMYPDGTDTFYFPYKYHIAEPSSSLSEYLTVFRIGEQYLIRSEARAMLGKLEGAKSDLDVVRSRAGLAPITVTDQSSMVQSILHERQIELFAEWGHRWFDLKRLGKIDEVMTIVTPLKANGEPWHSFQQWYPLPLIDIQRDPNLVQNDGY